MKVLKFGGSSLSCSDQLVKVKDIIQQDKDVKCVVVSAPGKRFESDTKITDLLIALHTNYTLNLKIRDIRARIESRYIEIIEALNISHSIIHDIQNKIDNVLQIQNSDYLLDALKSLGERFNAVLLSEYLKESGLDAKYVSPEHAGITVTDTPQAGLILEESYQNIKENLDLPGILVIPGFYGVSKNNNVITFKRGGSDITGSIIAKGINASVYENYTDQSYIYRADPKKLKNPKPIYEMSYLEMRTLSYSGFGIFHEEALAPLYHDQIPIIIKNTNQPEKTGTKIVSHRDEKPKELITGIASRSGFINIVINKYMMDRDIGFLRKVLKIFEEHDVYIDYAPTSVDYIALFIRKKNIKSKKQLDDVLNIINETLRPDNISIQKNIAILNAAGEGMNNTIGSIYHLTEALSKNKINIIMTMTGALESSIIFAIDEKDEDFAIESLYNHFF